MTPSLLIRKVQTKTPLTKEEVFSLIEGFKNGEVPDYQMSAFLMAVYYQGLSKDEKIFLTEALLKSGIKLDWSDQFNFVDKHSTGGTGDKTSIVIAPLLAALGYKVPMMAGRGLGHTGGTLDKLESLTGFTTDLNVTDLKKNITEYGFALIGQTDELCPADKKLYALRDVTCTVSSLPLITASIVSKKIAEGVKALVYDVKTGSGAFIKNYDDSVELAKSLIETSEGLGAKTKALITDMSQPLGRYVGNSLEMYECFEILKYTDEAQKKYSDTIELSIKLCVELMSLYEEGSEDELYEKALSKLKDGSAFKKALALFKAQGWNGLEPQVSNKYEDFYLKDEGFLNFIDNEQIGWACVELGGGRKLLTDSIQNEVGFYFYKKLGDRVTNDSPVVRIYYESTEKLNAAKKLMEKAFKCSNQKIDPPKLIQTKLGIEDC